MPYKDPQVRKAYNAAYVERNRERLREYDRNRVRPPDYKEKVAAYGKERRNKPEIQKRIKALNKQWALTNPEKRRESSKQYRQRYPERIGAYRKAYNARHQEEILQQQRAYRATKKEKLRVYWRERYLGIKSDAAKLAARRKQQRDYYVRNRDKRIESVKEYQAKHHARLVPLRRVRTANRRSRELQNGGFFTREQWLARIVFYGFCCAYCSKPITERTVQIDHVIPVSRGGTNWPSNLVPACARCNNSKHIKRWLPQLPHTYLTVKES